MKHSYVTTFIFEALNFCFHFITVKKFQNIILSSNVNRKQLEEASQRLKRNHKIEAYFF